MNQMVERVARAMYEDQYVSDKAQLAVNVPTWQELPYHSTPGRFVRDYKLFWIKAARAAIEAMREPTSAMTKAGAESTREPFVAYTAWHWMVDEALKDG